MSDLGFFHCLNLPLEHRHTYFWWVYTFELISGPSEGSGWGGHKQVWATWDPQQMETDVSLSVSSYHTRAWSDSRHTGSQSFAGLVSLALGLTCTVFLNSCIDPVRAGSSLPSSHSLTGSWSPQRNTDLKCQHLRTKATGHHHHLMQK